jgi:hypothetical protein
MKTKAAAAGRTLQTNITSMAVANPQWRIESEVGRASNQFRALDSDRTVSGPDPRDVDLVCCLPSTQYCEERHRCLIVIQRFFQLGARPQGAPSTSHEVVMEPEQKPDSSEANQLPPQMVQQRARDGGSDVEMWVFLRIAGLTGGYAGVNYPIQHSHSPAGGRPSGLQQARRDGCSRQGLAEIGPEPCSSSVRLHAWRICCTSISRQPLVSGAPRGFGSTGSVMASLGRGTSALLADGPGRVACMATLAAAFGVDLRCPVRCRHHPHHNEA